jgi:outer membrane lipoprotein-sorting protein
VNKFISCLVVATLTLGAIDRANAQPQPPAPTTAPKPTATTNPTPPAKPVPEKPSEKSTGERADLDLLTKALRLFWQSDRYQFDAEIVLDGRMGGESVKMTVRTNAISQLGNKFRADISLQNTESSPLEKYTIVSNGKRVWIYQPEKKIYTQMSWDSFNRDQSFVLGYSSLIFNLPSAAERKQLMVEKDLSLVLGSALNSSDSKDFSGQLLGADNREFGGKSMYVYTFDGKNSPVGLKIAAAVEPATGLLKQMKLSGKDSDAEFMMTENIRSRTNNGISITSKTFQFIPPKGVKKVKSIPINMFGRE